MVEVEISLENVLMLENLLKNHIKTTRIQRKVSSKFGWWNVWQRRALSVCSIFNNKTD